MIIFGKTDRSSITISSKLTCLTISFQNQKSLNEVYSFDYEGRLWTAMIDDISYRRGLDGKIVAKWNNSLGQKNHKWLTPIETQNIEDRAREKVILLANLIQTGELQLDNPLPQGVWNIFDKIYRFDHQAAIIDVKRYHAVYKPVGILPPDQYMSVVLQATEGCSYNTCTFCNFYKKRSFRIKSPEEFKRHAEEVRSFLGSGLSLRRTIFFGDANALVIPTQKLFSLLDVTHQVFDVAKLGGIYAFLDGFSGERKTKTDYQQLAEKDVKRIYIGMETGDNELLRLLKKPGTSSEMIRAVQNIKAGGIAVGIIILLGAGGKTYSKNHIKYTVQAINEMELGIEDILYFSELVENDGMQYVRDAYQHNFGILPPQEITEQGELIQSQLIFEKGDTPHISRYDIREFVY
jgi:hypothetical protein